MTIFFPSFHHIPAKPPTYKVWIVLSRRSAGTGSLGFTAERFVANNLKLFTAQRVLVSVLDGVTPHAAFSLSGEVVIGPNHLWLITSFKAEAADVASSAYVQCLNHLDSGRSGFSGLSSKRTSKSEILSNNIA